MKKLEDISKSSPFEVPDGYFDRLPGIIQARVTEQSKASRGISFSLGFALKYALPVLLFIGVGLFWFSSDRLGEVEYELEKMHPDQLSFFLNDTDASTEEIIETVTWTTSDLDELENDVNANLNEVSNQDLESMMDEYDVEL